MKISRDMFRIYLPVFLLALIIRAVMFFSYLHSALSGYSYVYGLDMETLVRLGQMFSLGKLSFNFHAALTGAMLHIWGKQVGIHWIIIGQMAGGIVMSCAVAYVVRHMMRLRWAALLAGGLAATYVPEVLYESVTLKESVSLLLAALALAAVVWIHRSRFSTFSLVLGGILIVWPGWIRFTGLLWFFAVLLWLWWCGYRQNLTWRRSLRRTCFLGVGAAAWIMIISVTNFVMGSGWWPFMFDSYNLRVGWAISAKPEMTTLNVAPGITVSGDIYIEDKEKNAAQRISMGGRILRAADYFCQTFMPFELADNVNYYYLRQRISWLSMLPGPGLIFPLAVTAFLIWMVMGLWRRREGLIILYVIVFILPLIFWVPVGRYRIVILPALCYGAVWLIWWFVATGPLVRWFKDWRRWGVLLLLIVVWGISRPLSAPLRASDFIAEGKAWEALRGKGNDAAYVAYEKAWLLDPNSIAAVVNYGEALLTSGKVSRAEQILAGGIAAYPGNFSLRIFYVGSLLAGGKAVLAEKIMKETAIPPENRERFIYYYHLGECSRLNGKASDAIAAYRQALPLAVNDVQRRQIQQFIDILSAGRR